MRTKLMFAAMPLFILILVSCGSHGDNIIHTEDAHTYEGYPVVYVVSDVSSQGLLSAYELLESPDYEATAIQLSDTKMDESFEWSDLIDKLSESLTDSTVIETTQELALSNYDSVVIISHFRSHETLGFDRAVKQMADISQYVGDSNLGPNDQSIFEWVAETGKHTADNAGSQMLYINVMDCLSVESGGVSLPDTNTYSVGIFSSYDPVAVDQACVDMHYMIQEGASFAAHIESCRGIDTLIHAERIGLGSRTYAMTIAD